MCKWCEMQISAVINKVLLEHSHAHFLGIVHVCFYATTVELNTVMRLYHQA